jgi:DNA polymerase-3 subunit delta
MADNYFVIGEEEYLVDAKVQELIHRHGGEDEWSLESLSSWDEANEKLLDMPMFSQSRVFLIEYQDLLAGKPDLGRVEELLSCHENVLIIYTRGKVDKRSGLYKKLSKTARLIEVIPPKGSELIGWVLRRGMELGATKFDRNAADNLVYLAGTNLLVLDNELKKLINYNSEISVETVQTLAVRDIQTSIFTLVDYVVGGQLAKAQMATEDMLRTGAEVPYILFMLGRQYRLLFEFLFFRHQGHSSAQIQRQLPSMHPYAFQKLRTQATSLDMKQCAFSLESILDADYSFKTGRMQGAALLQVLLVKIAKK